MTTKTLTHNDRLTIVKLLAAGRDPDFVATATDHERETVLNVGASHGYPDTEKLGWAADILAKQTDEIPAAKHTRPTDLIARRTPTPAPRPAPAAAPAERPDEAHALIATGKKSTRARTRTLAERAEKALAVLAAELDDEQKAKRAAAAKTAQEARVRSEVARLEAELAALKANLTKSRAAKGTAATRVSVDPKAVRSWAKSAGVECPGHGRVPNRVVEQYLAAHPAAA